MVEPKALKAIVTVAGYHIEKGVRDFAAFSAEMAKEFKDWANPTAEEMRGIYNVAISHVDDRSKGYAAIPSDHQAILRGNVQKAVKDGKPFSTILAHLKAEGVPEYADAAKQMWAVAEDEQAAREQLNQTPAAGEGTRPPNSLDKARNEFRRISRVIGWPKLLLCSTAGTLVAALVMLAATPIFRALFSAIRLEEMVATVCIWGVGLLSATSVGILLGIRAGTARAIRRLPVGYRLWFDKESPMAEARRVIDLWDNDSERTAFLSYARHVGSTAEQMTDAKERMEYFTGDFGYLQMRLPAGYELGKHRLLLLLCNGIEKALAEFTPDIVSAAGKPHGDDFDEWIDMSMDLTVQEYERRRWYGEDAAVLAPRVSERAQISLADNIIRSQWGRPSYSPPEPLIGRVSWVTWSLASALIAALFLGWLVLLVGLTGCGLAVIFTASALMVEVAASRGEDAVRRALPSGRRTLDVRSSLVASANPLERVAAVLGALDREHRNRLLVKVSEEMRTAVKTYEARVAAVAHSLKPSH